MRSKVAAQDAKERAVPKFTLEEFLLPHERDKDGKKFETPEEIDVEKLRKYVFGLLEDKEKAQEARDTAITEKGNVDLELKELRQKNESDEERRQREQKERDAELEALKKDGLERKKLDALAEAFPDATAARIKKLAKRVTGDEKDWVDDAKELVEDGFKISDKPVESGDDGETVETGGDLSIKPVRRSDGRPVETADATKKKSRSVADELDAAGIGRSDW